MRKLLLANYEVDIGREERIECPECHATIPVGGKPLTYDVRDSIIEVMMSPELRLGAVALMERYAIARRLMDCEDDEILLEEADYHKIRTAFEETTGFNRRDVELVRRVLEAPEVAVREEHG